MTVGASSLEQGITSAAALPAVWFLTDEFFGVVVAAVALFSIPLVVHWSVQAWHRRSRRRLEKQKPPNPVMASPPLDDLRMGDLRNEIRELGSELRRHRDTLEQLSTKFDVWTTSNSLAQTEQAVHEANQEILDSIYSEVNRATAVSLGEVLDSIKMQMRDIKSDLSRQIQELTGLAASAKAQANEPERGGRVPESVSDAAPENPFCRQASSDGPAHSKLQDAWGTNLGAAAASLGETAGVLAASVKKIEENFQGANLMPPVLAGEILSRLLRFQSLAQSCDRAWRQNELPPAEADRLEPGLDEVIQRDLPELVKICDSTDKNTLFDNAVRELLQAAHLEDILPRIGDRYNPSKHVVQIFEQGPRDTVVRVLTRGFRYKQHVLSKPEVTVGR